MLLMLFAGTKRGSEDEDKAPAEVQRNSLIPADAPLSSTQNTRQGPNCHQTSPQTSGDVLKTSSQVL
ncbi:hypothetical protein NQZ68_007628 [Dissostichus eleginoides]|nr:hypothetical protein NQZ68_007628 [Dissostichus eleginoides]